MAFNSTNSLQILLIISILLIFTVGISAKRLCGRELADTLKAICRNNYNGFGRLTAPLRTGTNPQQEDQSVYQYQSVPFLSKLTGGLLSPQTRKKRQGVSDECCKKACTYNELSSYCYEP